MRCVMFGISNRRRRSSISGAGAVCEDPVGRIERVLRAPCLQAALQRENLTLIAWRSHWPVVAVGGRTRRRVRGLYDPTLRRIELFDCSARREGRALVHALAHELAHAGGTTGEDRADELARCVLAGLEAIAINQLAQALRRIALEGPGLAKRSACDGASLGLGQ
jgi:hypothetical protein